MATTCWGAGGHRDAHQSKMLWLSLCNGLKQCMTMTEHNIVISSMWHQQQIQTGQQLGRRGVEVSVSIPVAWLAFRKVSSQCRILPSPLRWTFQMTTKTGSPSVPWNGFATSWHGFVWCGSVGERAPKDVRGWERMWMCENGPSTCGRTVRTRACKKLSAFVI